MEKQGRKIDHINITVPNLEEAILFYTQELGCTIAHRFMGHKEFVFLSDGINMFELVEDTSLTQSVMDHIAYVSEDIQQDYAYYQKLGCVSTPLGYIDFLFDNGMDYFFINGGNSKIEFCQKRV